MGGIHKGFSSTFWLTCFPTLQPPFKRTYFGVSPYFLLRLVGYKLLFTPVFCYYFSITAFHYVLLFNNKPASVVTS